MTENKKRKADGNTSADLSVANIIITNNLEYVKGPKKEAREVLSSVKETEVLVAVCDLVVSRYQDGKPMTARALAQMLRRLNKISSITSIQVRMLERAVECGWRTVYPIEDKKTSVSGFESSSFSLEKARTKINNFD